ncbi:hypothetical protein [Streptacidiphilus monticola]|jgi:hypothetical protein|uniref:Uncharacterized protein n=1 Tax=Streptacidiphilus monticola TaxID=2161674 RepID=A0ABW1G0K5_9ACTN
MATAITQQATPRSENRARAAEAQHRNPVRAALRGVGIFAETAARVLLLGEAEPGPRR